MILSVLFYIPWALILWYLLERTYHHLFCYQPVYFKLNAGNSYHAYTAKERISRFHSLRQIILMASGVLLLTALTGYEIFNSENAFLKGFFLMSLAFILQPVCELIYYKWSVNRYWKDDMTAKEMSAYHDFCQRCYRHSFSLNGTGRQRLRFILLTIGVCILISLSLFIFKL